MHTATTQTQSSNASWHADAVFSLEALQCCSPKQLCWPQIAEAYGMHIVEGVLSHQLKQFVIDGNKVAAHRSYCVVIPIVRRRSSRISNFTRLL